MSDSDEFDFLFKIVITGDSGVGKTNLLSKYVNNRFQENTKATIGVELTTKTLLIDGQNIQSQIWDTAGQERFRAITSAYYRNAVGAIIVFDLTKPKTFENLNKWLREVKEYAEPAISIVIIGNKSDLTEAREIKSETIDDFITQNHLTYLQTSAVNGTNVARTFESLITQIYHKQKRQTSVSGFATANDNGLTKIDTTATSTITRIGNNKKGGSKKLCC